MAEEHPDFESEAKYLDEAVEAREHDRRFHESPDAADAGSDAASQRLLRQTHDEALRGMAPKEAPAAHGRMDLSDGEKWYIGYHLISSIEGVEPLVINWQCDFARKYYEATLENSLGLKRRRDFTYRPGSRILERIDDQNFGKPVESATASGQTETTRTAHPVGFPDSLIEELDRARTGEMADIVRTMGRAQSEVIRTDPQRLLVVQGGPGTGKTAVVLHRVSWLLSQHGLDDHDLLVVGPNRTFLKYIGEVLPALGDLRVPQVDIHSLSEFSNRSVSSEDQEISALKGSLSMAAVLQRAVEQRVQVPPSDITWRAGGRRAHVSAEDVQRELARRSGLPHMEKRRHLWDWLRDRAEYAGRGSAQWFLQEARQTLDQIVPSLSARRFMEDLFNSKEQLEKAADGLLSESEIALLQRKRVRGSWSAADLPLLDYADRLISDKPPRMYRHIVVDEAQDLSPMQLKMIDRRSVEGSITLAGDIAQSTGPFTRQEWSEITEHLTKKLPVVSCELEYGYRIPGKIYALAQQYLPSIAPEVTPPRPIRAGSSDPELVAVDDGNHGELAVTYALRYMKREGAIGIIADPARYDDVKSCLERHRIDFNEVAEGSVGDAINLMTPTEAKGLEFDAVVLIEPSQIAHGSRDGFRLLYIALTRATQHLTVLGPLPDLEDPEKARALAESLFESMRASSPPSSWTSILEHLSRIAKEHDDERSRDRVTTH